MLAELESSAKGLLTSGKGPISWIGLRKTTGHLEAGDFDVLHGRGRKPVGTETVEEVTTAMVERVSSPIYSSARGRLVSRELR
ncbi:hypothetical protein TNCV_3915551 [Trichonephila clavipes]|nr:hypothetical protein TNCV_3915551 [Trichonephila clavipes]